MIDACRKKIKLDQVFARFRCHAGEKLAKYAFQVENDVPKAKSELPAELKKPVKPAKSGQSANRASKTTRQPSYNILPTNDLHDSRPQKRVRQSQAQSNQVKPVYPRQTP